jgi:hypothetical protein
MIGRFTPQTKGLLGRDQNLNPHQRAKPQSKYGGLFEHETNFRSAISTASGRNPANWQIVVWL